ncbi:UNVERIFIED_CONTAM: hypothetical protein Sindi_2637300, partial [Sesamum indicum]
MIFLPPEGKGTSLLGRLWAEEGFEPPDTVVRSHGASNPLSYRPHPVSTGFCSREYPSKKGTFPLPSHFGLRRCESAFISIKNGAFR